MPQSQNLENGFRRVVQLLKTRTGDLTDLETTNKTDLVDSINEIARKSLSLSLTEISAYVGTATQITSLAGDIYNLVTSSLPVDNILVLSVSGDSSKRWIAKKAYRISLERFGIVLGTDVSGAQITANTLALEKALRSGERLYIDKAGILVNGTITVTNTPVDLVGTVRHSFIRQTTDTNLFVFNYPDPSFIPFIQGVRLEADANFTVGAAITISGFPTQPTTDYIYQMPMGNLSNLEICGADVWKSGTWTKQWKKGIVLNTPNAITIRDIVVQGIGGTKAAETTAYELNAPRASVETVFDNANAYDVTTWVKATGTNTPGLEGTHFNHCTAVSCYDGAVITSQYGAPGWFFNDCHLNVRRFNFNFTNIRQGFIHDCLLYNTGNSESGDIAAFYNGHQVSDFQIHNVACYYQNIGNTNDAYGFLLSGVGGNPAVGNRLDNLYVVLKSGSDKSAVWFQNNAVNNYATNIERVGGTTTVLQNTISNTIRFAFPPDNEDGVGVVTLIPVDSGNPSLGKLIDIFKSRSKYVIIPSSETGIITQFSMKIGQEVTIIFDGVVTLKHDLNHLRLAGNKDLVTSAGTTLTFIKTAQRVEEINRLIDSTNILSTGSSVQSGNGSTTSFTIPHPFTGTQPSFITVEAGSNDAKNIAYIERDNTNIIITYTTAPPSGTNNLIFYWSAKK